MKLRIGDADLFMRDNLGERLGAGAYRTVFVHRSNPDVVVKIEPHQGGFANVVEWKLWSYCQFHAINQWLAPCVSISDCGRVLIQARTSPVEIADLPEAVPIWMTDLKPANWGRLANGLIVCHDYAANLIWNAAMTKRLKRADWTQDDPYEDGEEIGANPDTEPDISQVKYRGIQTISAEKADAYADTEPDI